MVSRKCFFLDKSLFVEKSRKVTTNATEVIKVRSQLRCILKFSLQRAGKLYCEDLLISFAMGKFIYFSKMKHMLGVSAEIDFIELHNRCTFANKFPTRRHINCPLF